MLPNKDGDIAKKKKKISVFFGCIVIYDIYSISVLSMLYSKIVFVLKLFFISHPVQCCQMKQCLYKRQLKQI